MIRSPYWTTSSIVLRDTIFEGYLVNLEPLRVGSGREAPIGSPVHLAVVRVDYAGRSIPYIPGSSLKGVFRSWAETMAKLKGLEVCSGLSGETCMDQRRFKDRILGRYILDKLRQGESKNAMNAFWKTACLVCKIFGSPSFCGKVFFEDAYPVGEGGSLLPFRTGTRTGIAIDRRTGAVFQRARYTVEYVEPGAKFRFRIACQNLPNYCLGLISKVLKMIRDGHVKIGGFKTRGFGRVTIKELVFRSKDAAAVERSVMESREKGVDVEVDLEGMVDIEDGRLVAKGDKAWKVLDKLERSWAHANVKG